MLEPLKESWENLTPIKDPEWFTFFDQFEANQFQEPTLIASTEAGVKYRLNHQDKGFGLRYESTVEQTLREIAAEIDKDLSLGASDMLYAALSKAVMARKTFIHAGYKKVED